MTDRGKVARERKFRFILDHASKQGAQVAVPRASVNSPLQHRMLPFYSATPWPPNLAHAALDGLAQAIQAATCALTSPFVSPTAAPRLSLPLRHEA
jgi:hypothetical protein